MIHIYCEEIDKMWFATATENEAIIATTFAPSENDALKPLLRSLPYNMPFQMLRNQHNFRRRCCQL